ncbi:B-4DMT family transporter [Mycobacterium europaeum]|uniref:B-4DMT family transporter n=1 Tax=Mycobacterium europaeum TaxID=761804 RepID=UPI002AE0ADB5|nr:B-4DMT family transporter [Mycobacterium europaeum]MEA1162482.1 B-4DMT family transporter [Mycobacterium europaeum]
MRSWMLRGLVYAAAMVVVRLFQGALINAWQTQAGLFSAVLLLLFIIGVAVWGVFDGRADAIANPDPDRRRDLAMTWLLAGLVAGVLSGAVSWLIALVYKGLYTGGLINELTTFAAFTALCVFLPGIIGVTIGRWRVDRNPPPRRPGTDEERADTDVFSAVRGDDAPTGEIPAAAAQHEERTAAVATAEREAPAEAAERDAPTETIAKTEDDPKTEVIRTVGDEPAKPDPDKG